MPNDPSGEVHELNWDFHWEVSDSEGLTLRDGKFLNMPIFNKLSLPVIRVQYLLSRPALGGVGPFLDQIRWKKGTDHGLQKVKENNNEYVGIVQYITAALAGPDFPVGEVGIWWLRLSVYARIGAYHIKQEWHLSETGKILPRVWSKGLHANMDHTHHPYWRFDFDIGESANNRVWVWDNGNSAYYETEYDDKKSNYVRPNWFVQNMQNEWGVWIAPGLHDGHPDDFSHMDVAVRLYRPEEDGPWPFKVYEDLGFIDTAEPVDLQDSVFWYIAHLFHDASDHGSHFHEAGPTLTVQRGIEIPKATKGTGPAEARPRPSGRVTEDTSHPQRGRPPSRG